MELWIPKRDPRARDTSLLANDAVCNLSWIIIESGERLQFTITR